MITVKEPAEAEGTPKQNKQQDKQEGKDLKGEAR